MDLILTASDLPEPVPPQAWPLLVRERPGEVEPHAAIRAAGSAGSRAIALVDGEVLLAAELLDWLATARAAGIERARVWTDGRVLARPGAAAKLRASGLWGAGVILFGAEAAAHDYVAGTPGRFAAALRGLKAARAAGLEVGVVAPVLRPTYRELALLVGRSLAVGVSRLDFVATAGPDREVQGLLPHLEMAAPHLRRALEAASRAGRPARSWLVPHCLLAEAHRPAEAVIRAGGKPPPAPEKGRHFPRKRARACTSCTRRASCGGPAAAYLDQHGEGGLATVARAAA